jgi:hypothetical protein
MGGEGLISTRVKFLFCCYYTLYQIDDMNYDTHDTRDTHDYHLLELFSFVLISVYALLNNKNKSFCLLSNYLKILLLVINNFLYFLTYSIRFNTINY